MFDILYNLKKFVAHDSTYINRSKKTKSDVNSVKVYSPKAATIHIRICLFWILKMYIEFWADFFRSFKHPHMDIVK